MVQRLVKEYPAAVTSRRGVGRLPVHYAVFADCPSIDVLRCLVEVNPSTLQMTDVYGRLPLHYAVDKPHPCREIIAYLLSVHPEGEFTALLILLSSVHMRSLHTP